MTARYARQAVTRWIGSDREAPRLTKPETVAEFFRSLIEDESKEHFMSLLLTTRHRCVGYQIVAIGSLSQALVHPREVFSVAVRECASAVILAHNHPSGDPDPSAEDRSITARLVKAGDILGIHLLDHLIVVPGDYRSFRRLGLLTPVYNDGEGALVGS
jgi:DNA repair protein RadC